MNLENTSPTKLQLLREDIRALQEERFDFMEDDANTAQHLSHTHATVAQYVEQMTKTGRIDFEEFKLRPSILLPRFSPRPTTPYKHNYIGEHVEPFNGKGLLYLFFEALKGAPDRLRQCPHCSARFVQARPKQRYCTRACQQVASMRALRGIPLKERAARKRKKSQRAAAVAQAVLKHKVPPTRDSKTRRRASDGKKRR